MFRSMSGFRADYHHLTMIVVSEFNEWKVLIHNNDVTIQGTRQFTEESAKEHAIAVAKQFIHEYKHEDLPLQETVEWKPTTRDDWLIWKN